jgi:hypothetical protein
VKTAVGGNPNEPACVKQKEHCSKCSPCSAGELGAESLAALSRLGLFIEQISAQKELALLAAASAWETDGASAAIKIAKHAIHAVKLLASRLILMPEFYIKEANPDI